MEHILAEPDRLIGYVISTNMSPFQENMGLLQENTGLLQENMGLLQTGTTVVEQASRVVFGAFPVKEAKVFAQQAILRLLQCPNYHDDF